MEHNGKTVTQPLDVTILKEGDSVKVRWGKNVTVYAKTDHMSRNIIFELTLVFTNTMPLVYL